MRKARKLKEARADGEERQTTKMTQFLGGDGEKKAPKKPVAAVKQLDAFESLIDGLGSGAVTERKSVDLGGGLGFANEAPSGPKVAPTPRRMTYDDVSPMPLWSAGVDLEASIGGGGDDMGMGFGSIGRRRACAPRTPSAWLMTNRPRCRRPCRPPRTRLCL